MMKRSRTTETHEYEPSAWPAHVEMGDLWAAIAALGAQIGSFDPYVDRSEPAPLYRAQAATARAYADLCEAVAEAYEASETEAGQCGQHLAALSAAEAAALTER